MTTNQACRIDKDVNREKAQSMVEFAVSAVIILMLLVGIVDFGRAFFTYVALRDAAQEGAVYGSMFPNDIDEIENRVRGASSTPVDLASGDILFTCYFINDENNPTDDKDCGSVQPVPGTFIEVTVSYPNFKLSMPFLGTILGTQTLSLQASVKDTILRNEIP